MVTLMRLSPVSLHIVDDTLSSTLPRGGGRKKKTAKTMKRLMLRSGIISVSLTLMCCLFATDANAQANLFKGIKGIYKSGYALAGKATFDAIRAHNQIPDRLHRFHPIPSTGPRVAHTPLSPHKIEIKTTQPVILSSSIKKTAVSPSPNSLNTLSLMRNRLPTTPQQKSRR